MCLLILNPCARLHVYDLCLLSIVQSSMRAAKRGAVGLLVYSFGFNMSHRCHFFLAGLRPAPPDPRPGTGCAGGGRSAPVWAFGLPTRPLGDSRLSYSKKGHFRTWLVYWLIV